MPSSVKDTQFNPVMARQRLMMQAASQVVVKAKLQTGELQVKDGKLAAGREPSAVSLRHRRHATVTLK
ncbi:hypothetical protein ACTUSN_23510 [Pantoea ananatis]|uniref:hypothetical protein n=1 Tax=Pantoea ananas TaxID=553 RepID=UPI003FA44598